MPGATLDALLLGVPLYIIFLPTIKKYIYYIIRYKILDVKLDVVSGVFV